MITLQLLFLSKKIKIKRRLLFWNWVERWRLSVKTHYHFCLKIDFSIALSCSILEHHQCKSWSDTSKPWTYSIYLICSIKKPLDRQALENSISMRLSTRFSIKKRNSSKILIILYAIWILFSRFDSYFSIIYIPFLNK